MKRALKVRQICFFIIAFLPVTKFFMLSSVLSSAAREDMWISGLLSLVFDLIAVISLTFVFTDEKRDFFTIAEETFGKTGKNILLALYLLFFLAKATLPVCEQKDYVEFTLYLNRPNIVYFAPFFICVFFVATKNLTLFGRLSDLFWLITVVGYALLIALSVPGTDFGAILPVGANGIRNIAKGTFASLGWFSDGAYFLFFIGKTVPEKRSWLKILLSFLLHTAMVTFFFVVFNGIFTSIGFRQRFALTETSKYATVINNLGRFDYIGITCILFSALFSLSLPLFFASKISDELFRFKKGYISPLIVSAFIFLTVLLSERHGRLIEELFTGVFPAYFLAFGTVFPLLFPLFKRRKNENQKD